MKKTVKTIDVVVAYQILSKLKISKLEAGEQALIGKALRKMRKIAKEYLETESELREIMEPANIRELGIIEAKKEAATVEERVQYQTEMGDYNRNMAKQLKEEQQKEVEIETDPISFELLSKLAIDNDRPLGDVMPVADIFEE